MAIYTLTMVKLSIRFNNNACYIIRNFVDSLIIIMDERLRYTKNRYLPRSDGLKKKQSFNALLSVFCLAHSCHASLDPDTRREPHYRTSIQFFAQSKIHD